MNVKVIFLPDVSEIRHGSRMRNPLRVSEAKSIAETSARKNLILVKLYYLLVALTMLYG